RFGNEASWEMVKAVLESESFLSKVSLPELEARVAKMMKPELLREADPAPSAEEAPAAAGEPIPEAEANARTALVDRPLEAATAKLEHAARWYVAYYRDYFRDQIRTSLDAKMNVSRTRLEKLPAAEADALVAPAVDVSLARFRSWLGLKGGAISVVGP